MAAPKHADPAEFDLAPILRGGRYSKPVEGGFYTVKAPADGLLIRTPLRDTFVPASDAARVLIALGWTVRSPALAETPRGARAKKGGRA